MKDEECHVMRRSLSIETGLWILKIYLRDPWVLLSSMQLLPLRPDCNVQLQRLTNQTFAPFPRLAEANELCKISKLRKMAQLQLI